MSPKKLKSSHALVKVTGYLQMTPQRLLPTKLTLTGWAHFLHSQCRQSLKRLHGMTDKGSPYAILA